MLPLAQNLLIFIVLGAPLSLLLPNFTWKIFKLEPTMAQCKRMLLNLLEVA
jgi:hypothetical protein